MFYPCATNGAYGTREIIENETKAGQASLRVVFTHMLQPCVRPLERISQPVVIELPVVQVPIRVLGLLLLEDDGVMQLNQFGLKSLELVSEHMSSSNDFPI